MVGAGLVFCDVKAGSHEDDVQALRPRRQGVDQGSIRNDCYSTTAALAILQGVGVESGKNALFHPAAMPIKMPH